MRRGFGNRAVAVLGPASPDLVDVLKRLGLEPFDDESGGATLWLPAEQAGAKAIETEHVNTRGKTLPEPLLLTINEAAAVLGVGRSTLYELIARRELEVVHLGRAARVPAKAVEELVERLRETGVAV